MERQLGYKCKGTAGGQYPNRKYHGQQVRKEGVQPSTKDTKEIPSDDKEGFVVDVVLLFSKSESYTSTHCLVIQHRSIQSLNKKKNSQRRMPQSLIMCTVNIT